MKKKRIMALLISAVLAVGAVGCGGDNADKEGGKKAKTEDTREKADSAEFTEKYSWSLSTTYPTGSPMVDGYYKFSELLDEYSGGSITLNVFPDSALMGENDSFLALKSSELEFVGCGPTPSYLFTPEYSFLSAPFLVGSKEEYQKLYNSPLFEQAKEIWRTEYNTRDVAGVAYRGFRNMSSNKKIETVEDLSNLKLRMNDNQQWSDTWKSLGATPVPIPLGELYTSVQNGTVDASEGPWDQIKSLNLEEVQDYIIETNHVYESAGIFMAEDLYESLPDNYKEVIDKAGKEAIEFMEEEAIAREDDYKQQLLDGGCELIIPELDGFEEKCTEILKQYFESTWTVSSLDEVKELMKE